MKLLTHLIAVTLLALFPIPSKAQESIHLLISGQDNISSLITIDEANNDYVLIDGNGDLYRGKIKSQGPINANFFEGNTDKFKEGDLTCWRRLKILLSETGYVDLGDNFPGKAWKICIGKGAEVTFEEKDITVDFLRILRRSDIPNYQIGE